MALGEGEGEGAGVVSAAALRLREPTCVRCAHSGELAATTVAVLPLLQAHLPVLDRLGSRLAESPLCQAGMPPKRPALKSAIAWWISSGLFITKGP